jgi:hypothetical protein
MEGREKTAPHSSRRVADLCRVFHHDDIATESDVRTTCVLKKTKQTEKEEMNE